MNARQTIQELKGKGWSDNTIARAIGCSQPTITRIRQGKSDPRESTALNLQKLLEDQSIIPEPQKDQYPLQQPLPPVVDLPR